MRKPKQPRQSNLRQALISAEQEQGQEEFATGGEISTTPPPNSLADSVSTAPLPSAKSQLSAFESVELTASTADTVTEAVRTSSTRRNTARSTTREESNFDKSIFGKNKTFFKKIFQKHLESPQVKKDVSLLHEKKVEQREKILPNLKTFFANFLGKIKRIFDKNSTSQKKSPNKNATNSQGESAISLASRLAEKQSERRKVRLRRFAICGGVVALVGSVVWALLFAPFARFNSTQVIIEGIAAPSAISETQVRNVVQAYDGNPLLLLKNSGLLADLENIAEVSKAELTVSFFSTPKISLQVAKPVFCIVQGDQCKAVNMQGKMMKVAQNDLANVPRLGGIPSNKNRAQVVEAALTLFSALDPAIKEQIAQVDYSAAGQFSFELKDKRKVIWGISAQNNVKAKILLALLNESGKKNFDVSLPEAPVAN